jgi:hypothetical protein
MSWYTELKKNIWKYALIGILIASICLNVYYHILLQNNTRQIYRGSMYAGTAFAASLGRATFFLNVQKPETIGTCIKAYVYHAQEAGEIVRILRELNPQHTNLLKACMHAVEDVVRVLAIAIDEPPTVPQILYRVSSNASLAMDAMAELDQLASQKIGEMGHEVSEAFTGTGVDASRLNNAIDLANELQNILNQWIDKYSQA